MRIACIGECMVELSELPGGTLTRGYGGDTLNTAVYLARLGAKVDYCTVLGDDPFSDEMLAGWQAEGVGTSLVLRLPGRLPGLYLIRRDAHGERSFFYWRGEAPARQLLELPGSDAVAEALAACGQLYLSGITLSLYSAAGRERLFATLQQARARGARVAFDTNFRPRGWPDRDLARAVYGRAFAAADLVLASTRGSRAAVRHGPPARVAGSRGGLRDRAQAGRARLPHPRGRSRASGPGPAGGRRRRHDRGGRQLRCRLPGGTPGRGRSGSRGARRPSAGRGGDPPSRCADPAISHAGLTAAGVWRPDASPSLLGEEAGDVGGGLGDVGDAVEVAEIGGDRLGIGHVPAQGGELIAQPAQVAGRRED